MKSEAAKEGQTFGGDSLFVRYVNFVKLPHTLPAQQRLPADSMELGRKFTQWLYTSQADSLLAYWLRTMSGR